MARNAFRSHDRDGTKWLVLLLLATLAALVAGWIAPFLLLVGLTAIAFAGGLALALTIPLLARKFLKENMSEDGFLHAWQPNPAQALTLIIRTLASWTPFGVMSVLLFAANGLLVRLAADLIEGGVRHSIERAGQLDDRIHEAWTNAPWWIRILPGDGAELVSTMSAGVKGGQEMLQHLLAVLLFLVMLEGILGWIFLVWLTIRSVIYLQARSIVSELRTAEAPQSAITHFRMGLLK